MSIAICNHVCMFFGGVMTTWGMWLHSTHRGMIFSTRFSWIDPIGWSTSKDWGLTISFWKRYLVIVMPRQSLWHAVHTRMQGLDSVGSCVQCIIISMVLQKKTRRVCSAQISFKIHQQKQSPVQSKCNKVIIKVLYHPCVLRPSICKTSKHGNLITLQHVLFLQILVLIHEEFQWCLAVINIRNKELEYLDFLQGGDNTILKVLVSLLSLAHTTSYRYFIFLFKASSYS